MRQVLSMAVAAVLASGCASATSSPQPQSSASPVATGAPTRTVPVATLVPTVAPTTTPRPVAGVHDLTVVGPAGFDGATLGEVVSFDGRFVAAGSIGGPSDAPRKAAVWSSTDGLVWTAAPDTGAFATTSRTSVGLPAAGGIGALAAGGSTVVGVGGTGAWDTSAKAAAWHSADGLAWQRATVAGSTSAFMLDVAAGGPGFVAVGATAIPDVRPYQEPQVYPKGTVWTSVDGATWAKLDTGKVFANGLPTRIVRLSGGPLVAFGIDERSLQQCSNCFGGVYLAWASTDGRTWSRLPELTLPALDTDGAEVRSDVIADGPRVLHWRAEGVFASADATHWASFAAPPPEVLVDGEEPEPLVSSVFATDGGLLAIGPTGAGQSADEDKWTANIWTWTPDGGWSRPTAVANDPPLPGWPSFGGMAAMNGVVVLVADFREQRNGCDCYPMSVVIRGLAGG